MITAFLTGDLVIYGNNLDAYGILQALLDCGVPPFKVLLARPDAEPLSSNPQIQEHIDRGLRECGAKVWDSITLKGWVVDEEGKLTELRMLVSNKSDFELSCHGLIYVDQKSVDMRAFKGTIIYNEMLVFPWLNYSEFKCVSLSNKHLTNTALEYRKH